MANKINFITGETYILAELFSGERKIIIPDLQRDYCWGDSIHVREDRELVTDFIDNLLQQYKIAKCSQLNLGLIYGYEEPTNHIQLCDGQQRITTLFLLIGMINRYSKNKFQCHLISDFEYYHDDKEPYLQYSIRESSLYFLSDLVCGFFIKNEYNHIDKVADISSENNSWYFQDYQVDPSIQSMLKALAIIEDKLLKKEAEESLCLADFGDYLVEKLTFMYYDMGSRRNGEETFVIINTTGEPLSATQNIKPLVINAEINKSCANIAMRWEEIETWFWGKRGNDNDTADAGFEEFMRWLTIIKLAKDNKDEEIGSILSSKSYSFPIEELSFDEIYSYWLSVKKLFEEMNFYSIAFLSPKLDNKKRILSQIDCFSLLPVIVYTNKFSEAGLVNIERVYQLFKNLSRYQSISVDNKSIYHAINAINRMSDKDIISLLEVNNISDHILPNEEKNKLKILKDNPQRENIEKAFWCVQRREVIPCHNIWGGQISPLIEWSTADQRFDFEKFKQLTEIFEKVFEGAAEANIDITRKALLTQNLKGYPRIFKGNTNYSFGWDWEEWAVLIRENKEEFESFFDTLSKAENINTEQQMMIDTFKDRSQWWSIFVESNDFLKYCGFKYVQLVNNDIIRLLLKAKASADHKYLYGWQEIKGREKWTAWRNHGFNCLYTDHEEYDIAIDLLVEPDTSPEKRFYLRLFNRSDENRKSCDLTNIARVFSLKLNDGRYISNPTTSEECYKLCEKIRDKLYIGIGDAENLLE